MKSDPQSHAGVIPSPLDGFAFTKDWLAGSSPANEFLGNPESQADVRLEQLAAGAWQPWTVGEATALAEFNRSFGNVAGASFAMELTKTDALVVVTGQQPDLLAAPLYVLHKALSAVAWSRKFAETTGRPVLPVFWVASDDDDFAELKQAWHVDHAGNLVDVGGKVSRGDQLEAGSPAYIWDLAESHKRLTADLKGVFAGWENGPEIAGWLSDQLSIDSNFETVFCRLLMQLLGSEYPMLFVAPRLGSFRQRQSSVLALDIQHHADLNAAINGKAQQFEKAGYSTTLHRNPDALNFFWLDGEIRHKLVERNGGVVALEPRKNSVVWERTNAELLDLLETSPQNFAPNVVTRPMVQDVALPSLAYIAGPGEMAYLALLGSAYQIYGQSRSAVIPRTLVNMLPADSNLLSQSCRRPEMSAESILDNGDTVAKQLLDTISSIQQDAAHKLERMGNIGRTDNAAVQRALDLTDAHIAHGLDRLKRRLARQVAPQEWARVSRLSAIVCPAGSSQERMLAPWNFVQFNNWDALARHLANSIDYTSQSPQNTTLPKWLEEQL